MSSPHDDLADELEGIVAELDDRAFALLREANAARAARPIEDKRLTQARRAIEKAVHLLRNVGSDAEPDETFD